MSGCVLLTKYLKGEITSAERISLLAHIKGCVSCGMTLKREGIDHYEAAIMLLADEDMANDPVVTDSDYQARKERNYQSLKKRTTKREKGISTTLINGFFSIFDATVLRPVFAAALILVVVSGMYANRYDIWSLLDPSAILENSGLTEKRGSPAPYVDLTLRMQKDNSLLHDNHEIGMGKVALFSYSVIKDAYISVIHIKDKQITIIKKEELTKDGEYTLDDLGWRFESRGDHYFIASASDRPMLSKILDILRGKGVEGLKDVDISISIKKVSAQ